MQGRGKAGAVEVVRVTIEVPVAPVPVGVHISKRIDMNLGNEAAVARRRLYDGLRAGLADLPGGEPVKTPVDAVRWLLEEIAGAIKNAEHKRAKKAKAAEPKTGPATAAAGDDGGGGGGLTFGAPTNQ